MTTLQLILIGVVLIPLLLAALEKLRMDLAALSIAAVLGLMQLAGLGMLASPGKPEEAIRAISGFSQPTVITLISLFILSRGLEKIGATRWVAQKIMLMGGNSESRLIALFAGTTAFISLFMNNLAAGALVLPAAMETCRRTGIRPSKILMPVAYGSLLGGAATYFTTANIVMSDLLRIAKPPQTPLTMLDFLPTGSLILVTGILYLVFWGKQRLPDRTPGVLWNEARLTGHEMENFFQLGERLWKGQIMAASSLDGKTLAETDLGKTYGLVVAGIWSGNQLDLSPSADQILRVGNGLLIVGREERVKPLAELGIHVEPGQQDCSLASRGSTLLEIVLSPHSSAQGKTLKDLDFRNRFGFTVLALRRMERSYRTDVGNIPLAFGDVLLVAGSSNRLKSLQRNADFFLLEPEHSESPVKKSALILTVTVFITAIAASMLGVPTYLAVLCGALVLLITRIISMEEAYQAVEWQAIFLIAGMYAVSLAMVETGLAKTLGESFIRLANPFGSLGLAAGAFLLTALLTQAMGGQVTALVTGPVTISAAISMGASPQAVAVATAIGCSASFLTPMAHPVNILMVTPANYRFKDFFHVGWPLTILSFLALLAGLRLFWGL